MTPIGYSPQLLERLLAGEDLTRGEARGLFAALMAGDIEATQIAALLIALRQKGETSDEVAGAAEAMRAAAVRIAAPSGAIDVCGTGGDRAGTLNVSTAAALVVAAAGVPVAKHGNRSVSSRSGSADVLEALGLAVERGPGQAECDLRETGFAFLYAPLYHPAMRHAAPVRRALGVRTLFNLLGPLTNPAGVRRQVLGVFDPGWVEPLAEVLGLLGAERAMVVHAECGLDELSLHGPTRVAEWVGGRVHVDRLTATELGFEPAPLDAIAGGSAADNAAAIERAFANPGGATAAWIALNAAAGLRVARDLSWTDAVAVARDTMAQGGPARLLAVLRGR